MGRVDAVDVEARVGLGVAQRLRLGQDVGEVAAGLAHRRQDVVRGAIEDAVDALQPVRGQAFPQGLDDRDAARDGRLEGERHAGPLGQPRQLGTVMGQHGLVGGDDRLALGKSPPRQLERHAVGAADQLDDDVDLGVLGERARVVVPAHSVEVDAAALAPGRGR